MIIFGNKDPTPNLDPESAVPLLPITSAQPGLTAAATVPDATCNAGTVCALVPCFSRRKQVFRWCRKARRRLLFPLFTVVLGVLFVLHVYPVLQNELQRYRDDRYVPLPLVDLSIGRCANFTHGSSSPGEFLVDMSAAYFLARGGIASGDVILTQAKPSSSHERSSKAKVVVTVPTGDPQLLEYACVCEIKERGWTRRSGVGIFSVPYRPRVKGRFLMTIELPAHPDTTFEEGNVKFDMPNFSLKFGMLKDAHFQRLEVQTTDKPIVAEWVSARSGHFETSNAPIKGTFFTTSDVNIWTSYGYVDVDLHMHDSHHTGDYGCRRTISASLKNTCGWIQAYANLTASGDTDGCFQLAAHTCRAKVGLDFVDSPPNSTQMISASTSLNTIDVTTHKNFEGTYTLNSPYPHQKVVQLPPAMDRKTGLPILGRTPWTHTETALQRTGAIVWGQLRKISGCIELSSWLGTTIVRY